LRHDHCLTADLFGPPLLFFHSINRKALCLGEVVLSLLVGLLVLRRSTLAFAAIWVFSAANLLQALVLLSKGSHVATLVDPHVTVQSPGAVIAFIAVNAAWLIYFHRSKRVAETFGSNL
jgi:hypothetical protein